MSGRIPGFIYDKNGFIIGKEDPAPRGPAPAEPVLQDVSGEGEDLPGYEESGEELEELDSGESGDGEEEEPELVTITETTPDGKWKRRQVTREEYDEMFGARGGSQKRKVVRRPKSPVIYQPPSVPYIPPVQMDANWQPGPGSLSRIDAEEHVIHRGMNNIIKNLLGSNHGIYLPGVNAPIMPHQNYAYRQSRRGRRSRRSRR
jgi:hypothetical protein